MALGMLVELLGREGLLVELVEELDEELDEELLGGVGSLARMLAKLLGLGGVLAGFLAKLIEVLLAEWNRELTEWPLTKLVPDE